MKCKCGSNRIVSLYGKCSDLCSVEIYGIEKDGYVPSDMGIGGNDDIQFKYCLDCGTIQGKFPRAITKLEKYATKQEELIAIKKKEIEKDSVPIDINNYVFDIDKPEFKKEYMKEHPGTGTFTIEEYIEKTK
jgi:hypothetical protein